MAQAPDGFAARHWRDRAKEARDNAARITDQDGKRLMLEIAATCDKLAKTAEEGEAR
jgi:hypothetical protein